MNANKPTLPQPTNPQPAPVHAQAGAGSTSETTLNLEFNPPYHAFVIQTGESQVSVGALLRDEFAKTAMGAILSREDSKSNQNESPEALMLRVAKAAYLVADAMLAHRIKK